MNALAELVGHALHELLGTVMGKTSDLIGRSLLHILGIQYPSERTVGITTAAVLLALIIGLTVYFS